MAETLVAGQSLGAKEGTRKSQLGFTQNAERVLRARYLKKGEDGICTESTTDLFRRVAKAVADSVADGVIPKDQCEDLVIVCGVFIHWVAADDKKIYDYNYEATKMAIASAMKNEPSVEEMLSKKDAAKHPFAGF